MWLYSITSFRLRFISLCEERVVMAHSTTRGLLYTAPPTEDEERTEGELTAGDRATTTAESGERTHPVADD
jgi:hypothetical protein